MNYRYHVGHMAQKTEVRLLTSPLARFLRRYPVGRHWPFDVLRFLGRQPTVIFDVGANTGMTSRYLRRFFPLARCHAFEPVKETYERLRTSLASDPNTTCHHLALGREEGTASIAVDGFSECSTLNPASLSNRRLETVTVRSLDSLVRAHGIARIDILKIDVQGFEEAVLQGAQEALAGGVVSFVYVEAGFRRDDLETAYFPRIHEMLGANGFYLSGFYEPFRYGPTKNVLGFCNVLYGKTAP